MAININGVEYTPEELEVLNKAGVLNIGEKHDVSSTTPSAQALHGPFPGNNAQFGVFSGAGVRPGMWGTLARNESIARFIPMLRSANYNENIEMFTGVTEGSGNNATSACADAPKAGSLKVMRQVSNFGIIHEGTKVDDVTQAGMRKDYADVDRELYNAAATVNPFLPQVPGIDGNGVVASRLRSSLFTLGVDLERNVSRVHYVGVGGTENHTYRGVARQWNGLDSLIKTGYTDSVTGVAVPAADSVVDSYNAAITGTDATGRDFVTALHDTVYSLVARAEDLQIPGTQWAIVMRRDLFREAAKQFAANLPVFTTAGTATAPNNRDGMDMYNMFNGMFNGAYLTIDGQNVPVILDNAIARETLGNNYYKSDIYIVPLTALGRPTLYIQYFDMGNPDAEELANGFGLNAQSAVLNGGLYRVFKRETKGCIEYDVFARVRMILDTPFLAARLDDVFYYSYTKQRDSIPGMSYYANGGLTYRG